MTGEQRLEAARRRAKAKFDFYVHLVVYLVVIGMLFAINLISWTGYWWFLWPALFWGVALAFHAASAFLVSQKEAIIDRMVHRDIEANSAGDSGRSSSDPPTV
ncbi:MAG: 2TM domain-containing protein [Boseongicola sp.]|nr:2TM domain-containing protein [Boseongicola sp.]NNJ69457.1 2TM domain-containing protein [Boseongicola sp.]